MASTITPASATMASSAPTAKFLSRNAIKARAKMEALASTQIPATTLVIVRQAGPATIASKSSIGAEIHPAKMVLDASKEGPLSNATAKQDGLESSVT